MRKIILTLLVITSFILVSCNNNYRDKADKYINDKYNDTFTYVSESDTYLTNKSVVYKYISELYPKDSVYVCVYENQYISDNYILNVSRNDFIDYINDIFNFVDNKTVKVTNKMKFTDSYNDIYELTSYYNIYLFVTDIIDTDIINNITDTCNEYNLNVTVYDGVSSNVIIDTENDIMTFYSSHKNDFENMYEF